MSFMFYF